MLLYQRSRKYKLLSDTFTMEMGAKEFIEFVRTKKHMIKASRFVPPKPGAHEWGKFIVEIQDGKFHLTYRKIGDW